ncbi:hypothetical protein [Paenibacillus hemerocallicola]|uniref:hypothetical protein n=1 Tax=Paenibacillus hemerocallicola TaxID=1172614 RepID=UPI00159EEC1A|nr:hypothetical protein [Paenibacillus hemerocallicola]
MHAWIDIYAHQRSASDFILTIVHIHDGHNLNSLFEQFAGTFLSKYLPSAYRVEE